MRRVRLTTTEPTLRPESVNKVDVVAIRKEDARAASSPICSINVDPLDVIHGD